MITELMVKRRYLKNMLILRDSKRKIYISQEKKFTNNDIASNKVKKR